jgi:hypothetical protein
MTTLEAIQATEQRVAKLQKRLSVVERGLRGAESVAKTSAAAKDNAQTIVACTAVALVGITLVALVVRRRRRRRKAD